MLGKGGKRKFDEHEDGLEGKIVSPSDGPSKVSYTLQRQTIFNISLMKLYNHRPLTEPSLQKTVLINNMLRRFQEELKQEGSLRPALAPPALPPEKDSFSSALDEIEELCPTSTSTEAAEATTDDPKGDSGGPGAQRPEGLQDGRPDDPKLMDSLPGNFEITTSTGFLTDLTLDDILFADIDTSMYDFDPCTSASGTSSKMSPVSADDLLKTLAPYSSQPVAPSQPFKMDLTELDHIMEVLVGS
ncbi:SERTA domain-containing protein 2, partial [Eschrichtius robustus]|nr:SERTA domain-containing protein 2 [Eschrichtius robustus]